MITGFGVVEAVKQYYNIYGRSVVQGFGNVGAAAAFYLTQMGSKVVRIIHIGGGLINE